MSVASTHKLVIVEPARRFPAVNWSELWAARGLFFFFVWRDIKVRYAQTVLGASWAVLQPLLTMLIFTVIFGRLAKLPSDGAPYSLFSLAGLVPWFYFSTALSGSSASLVGNSNLITKIYFPRLAVPFAPILAGLLDLAISSLMLAAALAYFGVLPNAAAVFYLPLCLAIIVLTAAGAGCWLAALNVRYRDVKYVVPFLLQIWMYASPIVYPLSMIPPEYRALYALNPLAGAIAGFRSVLLDVPAPDPGLIVISLSVALVLFGSGVVYFRHTEQSFADVV